MTQAKKAIGDHVKGTTVLGTPIEGKVVELKPAGYQLDTGKFMPYSHLEVPKAAKEDRPALAKWAEGHEPGYETREVLAGRYRGKSVDDRSLLTHAIIDGNKRTPCGKDEGTLSDVNVRSNPTCQKCAARVARLKHK